MIENESYKYLENLADLKNGNAILEAVEGRYDNNKLYTFVGSTLLALNPNRQFDIYDYPLVEQYLKNGPFANESHIFSITNQALRNISNGSKQETLLFSGSSGSGKTTNAFHSMRFLAAASTKKRVTGDHINALQVIFDRVGSAKTLKNDSATRIGYSFDFLYQKNELQGLNIKSILPLELSRLVLQKKGEQSFSVLYQLCAGLDFDMREKLGIKTAKDYFYLNQGKSKNLPEVDKQAFIGFQSALKTIGFSENQHELIYKLLAVVLHVGNIYFRSQITSEGTEIIEIANEAELKWISHLLEIDLADLKKVFLTTMTKSEDDLEGRPTMSFQAVTSIDKALDIRDSFAKTIYNELFKWVLNHISLFFQCPSHDSVISVIDSSGFEKYNNNSFEEFCINSVNEKLEQLYIQKIFKNFQVDYEDEGIACDYRMPSSLDNGKIVKMIFNRPCGIFPLLMDESRFPKGSDEAFYQRSNINHLDKRIYSKPRSKEVPEFGIRHVTGLTYYNVEEFLAKNRWVELSAVLELLSASEDPSLAFFVPKNADGKDKTVFVAEEYSKAVSELYDRLNKENVHFIRCIRVNPNRTSSKFDPEIVGRQMKALAIQETYRMSALGYSHKIHLDTFIKTYRCLLPIEVISHQNSEKIAEDILNAQGTRYLSDYAIGSHSVFLKDRLLKQLEDSKFILRDTSAVLIQRNLKKFLAQKHFKKKKDAAVKIQSAFRGWNARKEVASLKEDELKRVEEHVASSTPPLLSPPAPPMEKNYEKNENITSVASVQWYDLPKEINDVLHQEAVTMPKVKAITNYLPLKLESNIPNVEVISIEEFAELNLKNHVLEARREPILTPFLPKDTERDFKLSCEIFKLILRYMNDTTMSPGQRCVLAKYIVQQGIESPSQRDEIFIQLCNQTYNNRNPDNAKTAWNLILMAVNSFPPGILIFPMIKNYFERQAEPLRIHLLNGLFRSLRHNDTNRKRTFASTTLEQQSFHRCQPPVIPIVLPDGDSIAVEVDPWTTIEEIVERVLRLRGLIDSDGWGLTIDNGDINSVVHGQNFLFDAISQFEIPSVPPEDSPFLNFRSVSKQESKRQQGFVESRSTPEETKSVRSVYTPMDPSLQPSNGILKSSGKYRMTPEEYANMSVASRIRNMKIPSTNGDVNKFLDEVFDQALPSNEENASTLIAASIKGGPEHYYSSRPSEAYRRAPLSPRYADEDSNRRNVPSGLSSSINLSGDEGRDSRFSGSLPPTRQIFSPSRGYMYLPETPSPPPTDERISRMYMNDDKLTKDNQEDIYMSRPSTTMQIRTNNRARTPTNMIENSRLGQIQPTSQHARFVGNSPGQSQLGRRRFESPAAERRARAVGSRSKSTPRGFTNGSDYPASIPPPDYDLGDTYTIRRAAPKQYSQATTYPRSISSTPKAARNGFVRTEEPKYARQQSYDLSSPHYLNPDARSASSRTLPSPQYNRNIDLQPRSPIYSYRSDTINRDRAPPPEPVYFENRTISKNGVNGITPRNGNIGTLSRNEIYSTAGATSRPDMNDIRTASDLSALNGDITETNGIYSRNANKSYHEPSISSLPKSAMSLVSAKSQSSSNVPATCFVNEPWKLIIRREVFFPNEALDDIDAIDLVYSQIIADCRKNKPHRIRHFERDRINSILNKYRVPIESLDKPNEVNIEVKQEVIMEARKWPLYFSRMYPVIEERDNERVFMILGVSENGIRLMTRNVENVNDPMVPQEHYNFGDILNVIYEPPKTLKIITKQKVVTTLSCNVARQAIDFINTFLDTTPKQKTFVISIADYRINKSNHLSFHNGDIIQVIKLPTHENPPGTGNWLYGKIGNKFGWFPAEYVQPTSVENEYGSEVYAPPSALNNFSTPQHYRTNSAMIYGSINGGVGPENVEVYWRPASGGHPILEGVMDSYTRRSRSHSRFPPIDEHPSGYPIGQPLDRSHRSKSLDNRRDFVPDDEYDPYRSIERNSTFHASLGRRPPRRDEFPGQQQPQSGGDFFNETITIPTAHTKSKFDERQKSEGADDDWTSYDRQVRYHTERTAYPVNTRRAYEESYIQPRGPIYYEDYSYRSQPQYPPELSPVSRYPESDYYQQRRMDQSQQQQQQLHQQQQQHYLRKEDSLPFVPPAYAQHDREAYEGGHAMVMGNESAMASAAAAGERGRGGHRSYHYHHESRSGGGGGASGKARYGQSNGFMSGYQEKRAGGGGYYEEKRSGGSFFGGGRRKAGTEPGERVYHRIHCCCFSFKWPPFAYEECEPPRPMYPVPPKASPMPIRHQQPPPSQY